MQSGQNTYKYYAFISYSRKNSKASKYLQVELEHFRIPVKYVAEENRPQGQTYLRPIFRDRRDLKVGEESFTEDIKAAIAQSRYLIVLCSPEAAASEFVEEEIKHFLAIHNNNYRAIVPVVLKGNPGSNDDTECLPVSLRNAEITRRNLASMILDEGDDEKTSWEKGAVDALSYMLKVDREKIKATVDAEKLRQVKIYVVIAIVASVIIAAFAAWALYNAKIAKENEKLAMEQKSRAEKNEVEALRQKKLAEANEKTAKDNESKAKANEKKATENAEDAKEALAFLTGVFQSTDPTLNGNKDLTVLDAIRDSIPRIKTLKKWRVRATILRDIGGVLSSLGEYQQAFELLQEAHQLNLAKNAEPAEIAITYNNMGVVYSCQGKYPQALEYHHKALAIREKVLGKFHSDTAASYNNIGLVYDRQGNYPQALEYHHKALAIREKVLGKSHPDTAQSYNNIGMVYFKQGNYPQALEYLQKALDIMEKVLGKSHPDTALSYNNIGVVYYSQGKYPQALEYHHKALAIREKVLGKFHSDTAASYNNIGLVYYSQGKYPQALEYHHKVLAIMEKVLGKSHPNTATSYNNIGLVYSKQENYPQALEYHHKALAIREKVLGKSHPDTAQSYNNIAVTFYKQKNYQVSYDYMKKAVDIFKKRLGDNHPQTRFSINFLEEISKALPSFAELYFR